MQGTRRQYLGGIGAGVMGALAGCLNDITDSGSNAAGDGDDEQVLVDETVEVGEDQYYVWGFSWDGPFTLEYEFVVRDGPPIDVFVVDDEELEHYEAQERFQYYGTTLDATNGEESMTLEAGDYSIVVDNTVAGEAEPPSNLQDDVVKVEVDAVSRPADS